MRKCVLYFLLIVPFLCVGCDKEQETPGGKIYPRVECDLMAILQGNYWNDEAYFIREVDGKEVRSSDLTGMEVLPNVPGRINPSSYCHIGLCRMDAGGQIKKYFSWIVQEDGSSDLTGVAMSPDYHYLYDDQSQVLRITTERSIFCEMGWSANQDLHLVSATKDQVVFESEVPATIRTLWRDHIDDTVVRLQLVWTRQEISDKDRYENAKVAPDDMYVKYWESM